ncbi:MAG: hypothetical protein AB1657_05195 [Candidatus Micrarchaeota archaeon]
MVMRTCTGTSAGKADGGGIREAYGGQSRNARAIIANLRHEDQMFRTAALGQLAGNTRALAYLAATADHSDVREAALKHVLKDRDGLFKILEGLTDRCPQPWERELVHVLREALNGSTGDKVLGLKLWQLENSRFFSPSGKCKGMDGRDVEFTDESPAVFSEGVLAGMIDAPQA